MIEAPTEYFSKVLRHSLMPRTHVQYYALIWADHCSPSEENFTSLSISLPTSTFPSNRQTNLKSRMLPRWLNYLKNPELYMLCLLPNIEQLIANTATHKSKNRANSNWTTSSSPTCKCRASKVRGWSKHFPMSNEDLIGLSKTTRAEHTSYSPLMGDQKSQSKSTAPTYISVHNTWLLTDRLYHPTKYSASWTKYCFRTLQNYRHRRLYASTTVGSSSCYHRNTIRYHPRCPTVSNSPGSRQRIWWLSRIWKPIHRTRNASTQSSETANRFRRHHPTASCGIYHRRRYYTVGR